MKFKINKSEFDGLSEEMKKEYSGEGEEFTLNLEGGEDTGALKRAKEHEKTRRQKAEAKLKDVEDTLSSTKDELDELVSSKLDNPSLEKKWQKKLDDRETELSGTITNLNGEINRLLVDNVADKMARDMSDSPSVVLPHIKNRLTIEMTDGKAVTKVKDADGELSALTLDELQKEFEGNKDFASVIRGSKGSGSGAGGSKGGGNVQKPDFTTATPKEKAEYLKSKRS